MNLRIAAFLGLLLSNTAQAFDEAGVQFFEQKIRPVLVEHCYSCHSVTARDEKKLQGGLYLDSAAGVAAGGESGELVNQGDSAESLLLAALKYDGIEMPPSGKLSDEIIADFAKWIELGVPDPRVGDVPNQVKREINIDAGKEWWAFRPLQEIAMPDAHSPIDGFIAEAQRAQQLKPNRPASKAKLIRRAYFDLVGLPPTPEQIDAYLADESPQAFEKVVDELLSSDAYGERWARHWLDAARFAESGGYEFDGFRPGAYHYRDWVIRALNSDMPYDQFVRTQIAGDLLAPKDLNAAAATGFLVAGPYPGQITAKTVERIRYDQLDDMMMTIGGSMLGLTLGCVRCHEHKYDPIPHQDYYALAASLASTVHGPRSFDIDPSATSRAKRKHRADHEPLVQELAAFATNELPALWSAWKKKELKNQPDAAHWQTMDPIAFQANRTYLKILPGAILAHDGLLNPADSVRQRGQQANVRKDETYRLTFQTHQKNIQSLRLDAFTDKSLPQRGPGLNSDGSFQLSELKMVAKPMDPRSEEAAVTVKLNPVFVAFEDEGKPLKNAVDQKANTAWIVKKMAKKDNAAIFEFDSPVKGFAGGTEFAVELQFRELGIGRMRFSLSVDPNPATWAGDFSTQHVSELRAIAAEHSAELPEHVRVPLARWFAPWNTDTAKFVDAVRDHTAAAPRPKLTEVYTTLGGGQDVFYLRRGEVDNKQEKAAPGFLQVLWRSGDARPPAVAPSTENPRISLANWMTDIDQGAGPLLARVMINRLWQHHFGKGIVGTPNDFGVQGDAPSHPELLEYLASELVRSDWKLKPLHRLMMLSETYRQSNEVDSSNLAIDPANRYFWYFRPRRLEAETIRDNLLATGGNLDRKSFGPSVLEDSLRRSIYLRVKRSELLPVLTVFDAPEPTQSIGERSVTTVPTQALAMMNSPFVRQQAEKLFERIQPQPDESISEVIERGYRIALGRSPTDNEREQMLSFIENQRPATASDSKATSDAALTEFCHVLLCLNEFVYVD